MVYKSKDRKSRKVFNAIDWLVRLVTYIPGRYEQTVRYYGWYSNKSKEMVLYPLAELHFAAQDISERDMWGPVSQM